MNNLTVQDVEKMAVAVAKSGLFGVKTADQALALMLIAQAEGRHPASAAQDYDIIQGRPSLKASTILARFQAAGGKIKWIERNDNAVEAEFSHESGGSLKVRWDMARANKAGLTGKSTWKQYPCQMLSARVISEGVRAVLPGCTGNFYIPEEVQDFGPQQQPTEPLLPKQEHLKPIEATVVEPTPEPAQQPEPEKPVAEQVDKARIDAIMYGLGDDAEKYLKKIGWFPLSDANTLKILARPDAFIKAVQKFVKEGAKK